MIRKILFVDDDEILRAAIGQRLSSYNDRFTMVSAVDGFDAVRKLKENPVSLVVVDLVMPRMDGMSLIEHLKQYYPDLPVIIISSIGEQKVSEVARTSAAFGYLNKPFQADDLIDMIQQLLAREAEGGIMNDVSPPVFMQLMEMDARSCTIRILDNLSSRGGILYFSQGDLVEARVGEVSGIDAAHQIFSWDRTTIFINNECRVSDNRINANLGSIIMKAVGMKDEQEERPEDYDEHQSIAFLSDEDDSAAPTGGLPMKNSDEAADAQSFDVVQKKLEQTGTLIQDRSWSPVIDQLHHQGQGGGMGKFVAAILDEGLDSGKVIVASSPAGVIKGGRISGAEIKKALLDRS